MVYERYCKLRDEKGITDYRVSKDTGMKSIKTLADYFGVTVDYFLEESE